MPSISSKIYFIIFTFTVFFLAIRVQAAIPDQLGDLTKFFVDSSYDASGRSVVNAALRKISKRVYFYADDNYFNNLDAGGKTNFLNAVDSLALEFDDVIYPRLTAFYGSEWNPGIDGDDKITILFTPMTDDAGGYFRTNDEFSKSEIADSNQREMIYFNAKHVNNARAKALIAHEFQHTISFYQKDKLRNVSDEVWLNEMRSEYAPTIAGYDDNYGESNIRYREKFFLATPNDPLTVWQNKSEDYGVINFFAQYAADHYGQSLFSLMIQNNKRGIASVNQSLLDLGFEKKFSDIFSDWTIANILNNCSVDLGAYCYKNRNLAHIKIDPTVTYSITSSVSSVSIGGSISDWSARWYKFSGFDLAGKTLRLDFRGSNIDGDFRVPYIVEDARGIKTINYMNLIHESGFSYIKNFGDAISNAIVIPASHFISIETASESKNIKTFTLKVDLMDNSDVPEETGAAEATILAPGSLDLPDGSLVRARGDYKVYIINNGYKRHILDGKIFDFYGHMSWGNIHEVDPLALAGYRESFWVRADGDKKVYEINGDKTKHWLNMSGEAFSVSGRKWEAVYIINEAERDFYITGPDVLF